MCHEIIVTSSYMHKSVGDEMYNFKIVLCDKSTI